MKAIKIWQNGIGQKELIKLLRGPLRDAHEGLIKVFQNLNFERNASGRSQVGRGVESMGRSIDEAVKAPEMDIPDVIKLTFPIYKGLPVAKAVVQFDLYIDPSSEEISIQPLGDQLTDAMKAVQLDLKILIDSQNLPVRVYVN